MAYQDNRRPDGNNKNRNNNRDNNRNNNRNNNRDNNRNNNQDNNPNYGTGFPKTEYSLTNTTFVNPYNFVPTNKSDIKRDSLPAKRDFTGYLDCSIYLKTPLCIPDVENVSYEKPGKNHPSYPFYTINGVDPVIPGSTIRGMIRSEYETVTHSCMATMKAETRLTRRVGAVQKELLKPGLLIKNGNGEWELYAAERYLLPVYGRGEYTPYKTVIADYEVAKKDGVRSLVNKGNRSIKLEMGDRVSYTVMPAQGQDWCMKKDFKTKKVFQMWKGVIAQLHKDDKGKGYVFIGEPFGKKKHGESVFERGAKVAYNSAELEAAIKGLDETIALYQNSSINRNLSSGHTGYANYEKAKAKGVLPVWYDRTSKKPHLSIACLGRIAYDSTLNELADSDALGCYSRNNLCPACRLFGMIRKKNIHEDKPTPAALGSRIRFTDAVISEKSDNSGKSEKVSLKELSSPRYSYLPFYLTDAKINDAFDNPNAKIAGRKYYWHQPQAANSPEAYKNKDENTDRNATMELLPPGRVFSFRIYCDRISQDELEALIWVLTLGNNDKEDDSCHKLGHGKPIGLGSVKIVIDLQTERSLDEGYHIKETTINEVIFTTENPLIKPGSPETMAFRKMHSFSAMAQYDVSYPYVLVSETAQKQINDMKRAGRPLKDNVVASHKWFSENKSPNFLNTQTQQTLKNPRVADQRLQLFEVAYISDNDFKKPNH